MAFAPILADSAKDDLDALLTCVRIFCESSNLIIMDGSPRKEISAGSA